MGTFFISSSVSIQFDASTTPDNDRQNFIDDWLSILISTTIMPASDRSSSFVAHLQREKDNVNEKQTTMLFRLKNKCHIDSNELINNR